MSVTIKIPTSLKDLGIGKKSVTPAVTKSLSNISSIASSTYISTGSPVWRNFSELIYLLDCYYTNPVVQACINIKAEAFANIKFQVKDLKSGEILDLEAYEKDNGDLYQLLKQPNPLQSTYEWLRQLKINREVFGNGYVYASVPVGFESNFTYQDVSVLNNLPPYCMSTVLTGNWLDATTKDEIISKYVFSYFNSKKKDLVPATVLHLNNANIQFDQNFTSGKSPLLALKQPISNIDKAYESKNVLITKRGALGILTSELKDDVMGSLPMDEEQIEKVQEAFKKYGTLNDQYSQIISPMPMKYTQMAQKVKDLMLSEEISESAIAVCNAYGIPEKLLPYYIQNSGLSSDNNVHEKRLYDSTIIPESKDFMIGLNNFFNTKELGIELLGTYNHLNVLQEDKKHEAETNSKNTQTAISAFMIGAIPYNEVLSAMNLPKDAEYGEKKIWDLAPEQIAIIGKSSTSNQSNNTNDNDNDD